MIFGRCHRPADKQARRTGHLYRQIAIRFAAKTGAHGVHAGNVAADGPQQIDITRKLVADDRFAAIDHVTLEH
jgi:hypothetical protein